MLLRAETRQTVAVVNKEWKDMGERLIVRYAEARIESDGTRVLIADGPVPEGIPVELHVLDDVQTKAVYADGYVDEDPSPWGN